MTYIIECIDLKKEYRMGKECVHALNGISLKVKKGEFIALLGKSGSGKSTLLNMMAGLEKPTSGQMILRNHHLEKLNETKVTNLRKLHVGFIFQSYNLLQHHTALENVTLPLIFNDISKKERNERARAMLELVGLSDRIYHKPNQMSGGQQQRVSIARAFVNNPEIIFADEPTGNLDTKTTNEILDMMQRLIDQYHQTVVMVTHDPDTSNMAHHVVHMKDGIIDKIIKREDKGDTNEKKINSPSNNSKLDY